MSKVQQQCNAFLQSLGVPGFIVIGIAQGENKADMVYSIHQMPTKLLVKSMTSTLNDFIQKM